MAYYKSKLASGGTVIGGVDEIPINSKNAYPIVYDNKLHLLTTVNDSTGNYTYLHYWDGKTWHLIHTMTRATLSHSYAIPLIFNERLIFVRVDGLWEWNNTDWERICALPSKASDVYPVVFNGKLHLINEAINKSSSQYWVWDGTDWSTRTNINVNLSTTTMSASQPIALENWISIIKPTSGNDWYEFQIKDNGYSRLNIGKPKNPYKMIDIASVVEYNGLLYYINGKTSPTYIYSYDSTQPLNQRWNFVSQNNDFTSGSGRYKAVTFQNKIHFINFADGKHYIFDGEEWTSGDKTLGLFMKQSTILLK